MDVEYTKINTGSYSSCQNLNYFTSASNTEIVSSYTNMLNKVTAKIKIELNWNSEMTTS